MIDLFPSVFTTLKASTYFSTTLSGFTDSKDRFKVFKGNESPSEETPFVSVLITPGSESNLTSWSAPYVTFTVYGKDTEWSTLYEIAENIVVIFRELECFEAVGDDDPVPYTLLGKAIYDEGEDPVTEFVNVSVALRFGRVG